MTDNQKQADYWSSSAGLKWIQFEEELDTVFEAVNETLVNMAQPQCGERIVDIGCGTGATTRAFAEHLGPDGYISAIDISKPLLSHAKSRSRGVETRTNYSLTDAQADAMTDGPFDVAVSRFGVMFFADPVAAFRNIRKWLRPGGRLAIAGWASVDGNPWFEAPRDGAIAQLGPADPSDPHAPGPLGFQNIDHVTAILEDAGFANIEANCSTIVMRHPGPLESVAALAANIGPAARIIKKYGGNADDVRAIAKHVHEAFRPFEEASGVRIPARLNLFTADAGN